MKSSWPFIIIFMTLLVALSTQYTQAEGPDDEWITIPVQAVLLSEDNGTRKVQISNDAIATWVAYSNKSFKGAKIRFTFTPNDENPAHVPSSLLNDMAGTDDWDWADEKTLGNRIAASYPGKMLVFFRDGARGAFSWWDYDFIVLPSYRAAEHCGKRHKDMLAHEIGHYLGLQHTFGPGPFETREEALAYFRHHGSNPQNFDGDGLSDTLPDPSIRTLECSDDTHLILDGHKIKLPRDNMMGYYHDRHKFSPQQITRMRWVAQERKKHGMAFPSNQPFKRFDHIFEADMLNKGYGTCQSGHQDMKGWGLNDWTQNKQLFIDAFNPCYMNFSFFVEEPGRYKVYFSGSRAPDFGRIQFSINGTPGKGPYDAYSPIVIPTGYLKLGEFSLKQGNNMLKMDIADKNVQSSGFFWGFDNIALVKAD